MVKYSFEFKKKVVMAYLNSAGVKNYLIEKFDISSTSLVKKWVDNYKAFRNEGLLRSHKQEKFSF